jgi:hypothetical protein
MRVEPPVTLPGLLAMPPGMLKERHIINMDIAIEGREAGSSARSFWLLSFSSLSLQLGRGSASH